MFLFLITFLGLYGALHAYVLVSLKQAFRLSTSATVFVAGAMTLMVVAPAMVRLLERQGHEGIATGLAWTSYVWMGSIFLMATALAGLDLLRLIGWVTVRLSGSAMPGLLSPRITCLAALGMAACATLYGFWEARTIRTEHLKIPTPKIPFGSPPIRIVQISDVHLGLLIGEKRLERILAQVRAASPDLLVCTGDLVDGRLSLDEHLAGHRKLVQMLATIRAPLGKFAVAGNHEFYAGLEQSLAFTRAAGFTILRGETAAAGPHLWLTGVDDPAGRRMGKERPAPPEAELLQQASGRYRVLLKHRPVVSPASEALCDLQLSGHTHQGQLFPFNLLVRIQFPVTGGTVRTAGGTLLHVSRGSGTWGPPLRLLAPPEVTVIDLIPSG